MIYLNCAKRAPNGSIVEVGGTDGAGGPQKHYNEAEAIKAILNGTEQFKVRDKNGHQADVRVAHRGSHQFLETHRDKVKTDNLDDLPTCHHLPVPAPSPQPYRPVPVHRGHAVSKPWKGLR